MKKALVIAGLLLTVVLSVLGSPQPANAILMDITDGTYYYATGGAAPISGYVDFYQTPPNISFFTYLGMDVFLTAPIQLSLDGPGDPSGSGFWAPHGLALETGHPELVSGNLYMAGLYPANLEPYDSGGLVAYTYGRYFFTATSTSVVDGLISTAYGTQPVRLELDISMFDASGPAGSITLIAERASVPEPSTMLLLGCGLLGLVGLNRRRKA